jgi:putative tryptophan/tyrosine transport system substrate-binding protein
VHRRVSLIVAVGGTVSARAAKEATATIPILFIVGPNPIGDGLVTSVSRPGGNATGVALYSSELLPKRLELLEKLLPRAARIAVLVNPSDAAHELETKYVEDAMRVTGQEMVLLKASAERDFEPALISAVQQRDIKLARFPRNGVRVRLICLHHIAVSFQDLFDPIFEQVS